MIGAELLSSQTLTMGWLIYIPALIWAIARAPWVELFSDSRRQHLLFGTVFALFMLWLVRRDFDTGVSYHFIGMTAVTLLLDWPLAIVGGLVAQVGLVLLGRQDLAAVGVNGALLILLPVLVTECCAIWWSARSRVIPSCTSSVPVFCRCAVGLVVPDPDAHAAVVRRAIRHAVLAGRLCRLPLAADFSGSVHQRHGGQRVGGVLPRMAGDVQSHALSIGASKDDDPKS